MAEADRLLRKAEKQQSAHALGRDTRIPRWLQGHVTREFKAGGLAGLPKFMGDMGMQDNDPASGTFGGLYFVPGISIPGGPDLMR